MLRAVSRELPNQYLYSFMENGIIVHFPGSFAGYLLSIRVTVWVNPCNLRFGSGVKPGDHWVCPQFVQRNLFISESCSLSEGERRNSANARVSKVSVLLISRQGLCSIRDTNLRGECPVEEVREEGEFCSAIAPRNLVCRSQSGCRSRVSQAIGTGAAVAHRFHQRNH